jgi:hypothetical protein
MKHRSLAEVQEVQAGAVRDQVQELDTAPVDLRDRMLDAMADIEVDFGRRMSALVRRVEYLEGRASVLSLSDEMKGFLVMMTFSVGAAIVVPILTGMIEKWRRS